MQVTAKLRYLRMSPRKVRLVADVIRGLNVKAAQNQLEFMNKRAARPMLKLLKSALANAKNNFKLKEDNLYISELRVDEGPTLKRWMPRAFGRAAAINKRSSHILIVLDEREGAESEPKKEELKVKETKEHKDKKADKDVKILKSLDEVKEIGKQTATKTEDEKKPSAEEHKPEPVDVRYEGNDRRPQHIDKLHKKEKGASLKRVFRRKSV